MRILILTPLVAGVRTGNLSSATQWCSVLRSLGHEVEIAGEDTGDEIDVLIGLHAVKCAKGVAEIKRRTPHTTIVVAMTGTDIYPNPSDIALATMRAADRLVGLQPRAAEQLPEDLRPKVRVIIQASAGPPPPRRSKDPFDVCVVGHLRDVKDPMLAAAASRLLPASSKVRIRHAGAILESKYEALVEEEQRENPRYKWLGHLDETDVGELISNSQLLVLSSLSEGAGRVIGSAISRHTPVLSTQTHGVVGMLGDDYPGLFPIGDTEALAELLHRAETEPDFLKELSRACDALRPNYAPKLELAGWRSLMEELEAEHR